MVGKCLSIFLDKIACITIQKPFIVLVILENLFRHVVYHQDDLLKLSHLTFFEI